MKESLIANKFVKWCAYVKKMRKNMEKGKIIVEQKK
jgi:hypothetical protein